MSSVRSGLVRIRVGLKALLRAIAAPCPWSRTTNAQIRLIERRTDLVQPAVLRDPTRLDAGERSLLGCDDTLSRLSPKESLFSSGGLMTA